MLRPRISALFSIVSQPNSIFNLSLLEKWKAPVTIFAALYCSFSSLAISVCFKVFKYTGSAQSITDLTVILYNRSRVCLLRSLTLLRTESFLLAFKQTSFTCTDQSNDEDKYKPRCLWTLTLSMYLLFIIISIIIVEQLFYIFLTIFRFEVTIQSEMRELRSLASKDIAGVQYVEKFSFALGLLPLERHSGL